MTQRATGIHFSWAAVGLLWCITSSSNSASSSRFHGMPCLGEAVLGQLPPYRMQGQVLQGRLDLLLVCLCHMVQQAGRQEGVGCLRVLLLQGCCRAAATGSLPHSRA